MIYIDFHWFTLIHRPNRIQMCCLWFRDSHKWVPLKWSIKRDLGHFSYCWLYVLLQLIRYPIQYPLYPFARKCVWGGPGATLIVSHDILFTSTLFAVVSSLNDTYLYDITILSAGSQSVCYPGPLNAFRTDTPIPRNRFQSTPAPIHRYTETVQRTRAPIHRNRFQRTRAYKCLANWVCTN